MEFSIELDELRDAAKRVLEGQVDRQEIIKTPSAVAAINRALWKTMVDLGWLGLTIPETHGGLGQPFTALATLYRELGRSLAGSLFPSAVIGLEVLTSEGLGQDVGKIVEAGMAGEAIVVAVANNPAALSARASGMNVVLDGTLRCLLGAGDATHLLVPFELDGPAIALIQLPCPDIAIVQRATWDYTREVFEVTFTNVEVTRDQLVLRGAAAGRALAHMAAHFDLALACDAIGGAEQILGETLEYMETRKQFNRPISSFQALKHRCADMKTSLEGSRALVDATCAAFSAARGEWQTMAACSRLYAGSVYRNVTEDAVQLHGGIGFTWEQSCHLFLKRARLGEVLGGTPEQRKDAAAATLLKAAQKRIGSLLSHQLSGN